MSKIEVLVTTMHQSDMGKYTQMNLQTDAVIANQTDFTGLSWETVNGNTVTMVSTVTRGLSRNRNIALAHSSQSTEYVLFSDDDLIFNEGYEALVTEEFEKHPEAEAIKFNIHDLSKTRKISMRRIEKFEKATRRNMSSSGVCALAVKRDVLIQNNIRFHENFGAGTENFCGEDTIFLMELLKNKVKMFRSPVDIAGIDQSESSWCKGMEEKIVVTSGKILGTIFPKLSYLLAIRSAVRFSKRKDCNMKFGKILRLYYRGIRAKH